MSKIILALESGGEQSSVALRLPDGQMHTALAPSGQSHSSELLPMAQALLRSQGLDWAAVDGYVLGSGPGSFTGLRIACGLIQGLAFGTHKPAAAVSHFEAWAFAWWSRHRPVQGGEASSGALELSFDARLGERYVARLGWQGQRPSELVFHWIEPPRVAPAQSCLAVDTSPFTVLRDPCAQNFGEPNWPAAAWAAELAAQPMFDAGLRWREPQELLPLYVREKVAMTVRERAMQADLAWRPMTVHDLASVMVIERQAYPFPWTSGNFQDSLKAGYEALVLIERGVLIGYLVWMPVLSEAHLLNFTLSPARQGHGLGTWMLQSLIDQVRAKGMEQILLEVRPSNQPARRLYEKFGFQLIGTRKGYYPNHADFTADELAVNPVREDAKVMRYALSPAVA